MLDRATREDLGAYADLASSLGRLVGEEKVFDTWMDSSNSNLFVSGYADNLGSTGVESAFNRAFPTGIRTQGKEIVRTWLYYTLLKSTLLLDKPGFKHVWIDGLGMDPWGRKMSKCLGNGIDADSVLECGAGGRPAIWQLDGPDGRVQLKAQKIGIECFRLWKACDARVGEDFHIDPQQIEAKYFGVLTKMFNIARFASQFSVPEHLHSDLTAEGLHPGDRWILSEFALLLHEVERSYQEFDICSASRAMKNFGTGVLSSHWLEMAKDRLHEGDRGSTWTLHRIVRDWLTLFSPVCPMFAHYLSATLYHKSAVDIREFPKSAIENCAEASRLRALTRPLCEFNSLVWRAKQDAGLSLNVDIAGISIPDELEEFGPELMVMHRLI